MFIEDTVDQFVESLNSSMLVAIDGSLRKACMYDPRNYQCIPQEFHWEFESTWDEGTKPFCFFLVEPVVLFPSEVFCFRCCRTVLLGLCFSHSSYLCYAAVGPFCLSWQSRLPCFHVRYVASGVVALFCWLDVSHDSEHVERSYSILCGILPHRVSGLRGPCPSGLPALLLHWC